MNVVTARADGQAGTLALAWSRRASHDHALELSFRKGVGRGRSEKTFFARSGFCQNPVFSWYAWKPGMEPGTTVALM